jgi:hypothetical protein
MGEVTIGLDRRRHIVRLLVWLPGAVIIGIVLLAIQGPVRWFAAVALMAIALAFLIGLLYLLPRAQYLTLDSEALIVHNLIGRRTYSWADISALGLLQSRWLAPPFTLINPPTMIWLDLKPGLRPAKARLAHLAPHDAVVGGLWSVPAPELLELATRYWHAFGESGDGEHH